MKFRAFVALPVAGEVQKRLAAAAGSLQGRDKKGEVRWTDPQNYHVTLAFLDDIHVADADGLMTLIQAEVADSSPFDADVSHVAYFPASARPRLVLAHLQESAAIMNLQRQVARAVRAAGLRLEKRRFVPHVTLGRLRGRRSPWLEIPPVPLTATLAVDRLHLYRSERDAGGARYQVVHTAGLSGDSR